MFFKSKKTWLIYFIYTLILLLYIFLSNGLLILTDNYASTTYNVVPSMLVKILLYIVFGMLLGFSCLFREYKKKGNWKINISKLFFLGIPGLYYVLCFLIRLFNIEWLRFFIVTNILLYIENYNSVVIPLLLLLGYAVVSSICKTDRE